MLQQDFLADKRGILFADQFHKSKPAQFKFREKWIGAVEGIGYDLFREIAGPGQVELQNFGSLKIGFKGVPFTGPRSPVSHGCPVPCNRYKNCFCLKRFQSHCYRSRKGYT